MFRFQKTDTEVAGEMLSSKDKDTLLECISAGVLPEILQRGDVDMEVVKRREQGSSLYLDKETGELVSYAEMKAQGGLSRSKRAKHEKRKTFMKKPGKTGSSGRRDAGSK